MDRDRISIKGTGKGIIITIGSGNWRALLDELGFKLEQKASFFKGGRVALNVGGRLLNKDQLRDIGNILADQQMTLWAVNSSAPETCTAAQHLGLEVSTTSEAALPNNNTNDSVDDKTSTTATIHRTLRSGQRIEHPGNVVVIGDVNPGAEVRAGGHIIVWGRLRGIAHAGALSPENGFVCALKLAPMQLIIGNIITRAPAEDEQDQILPEMAFVQDGQIVAEAWE